MSDIIKNLEAHIQVLQGLIDKHVNRENSLIGIMGMQAKLLELTAPKVMEKLGYNWSPDDVIEPTPADKIRIQLPADVLQALELIAEVEIRHDLGDCLGKM